MYVSNACYRGKPFSLADRRTFPTLIEMQGGEAIIKTLWLNWYIDSLVLLKKSAIFYMHARITSYFSFLLDLTHTQITQKWVENMSPVVIESYAYYFNMLIWTLCTFNFSHYRVWSSQIKNTESVVLYTSKTSM